jgi:phytoene/squalene synthetase
MAMTAFDVSEAHNENPSRQSQGIDLMERLTAGHREFVLAARQELGIQPPAGDESNVELPLPDGP